ncbi:hypothetical protein APF79_05990 [bacterium BRH_c32]|nr:MAG: hypothetical protein APF79_05990 [bacterium BRH_c32]
MKKLISKNVFIDTSIYVKENFQYYSEKFDKLKSYAQEDKIKLYTHNIICNEIKSNIVEEINQAINSIKKIKSEGKIFWNLPKEKIFTVFEKHDLNHYRNMLYAQLDDFINSSKCSFIPDDYNVNIIFEYYFNKKSPFGEGKKKSEFPDAFVLSAIENWCKTNDEKIYLLSIDGDWKDYANNSKNMLIISSIEELLQLITIHYEKLSQNAIDVFEHNINKISEEIESAFMELGFILEDVGGDVDDVDVDNIEIIDKYLISIESDSSLDNSIAQFEITASVSFSANTHYGDESTAPYDSEEKRLLIWEYIDKAIEQTEEVSVELKISFDSNHDIIDVESIRITDPRDIWVSIKEDKYPYK